MSVAVLPHRREPAGARGALAWALGALGLCAAACGPRFAPRPPIAATCAANRVGAVTVDGAPRTAVPALAVLEGTLDDPARAERVRTVALAALRTRGHARARIALSRTTGCGVELHARVTLGPRFTIARIEFDTDDAFPAATRLAVIEDALGTINTIGGTYAEDRLRRGLHELRKRYEDAGWLDAKIAAPRAHYGDDGRVAIEIPIRAGARFKIGSVRAVGGGRVNRKVIEALGLREGAYYDKPTLRSGIERARRRFARYIQVRVEVAPERREIDVEAIIESLEADDGIQGRR